MKRDCRPFFERLCDALGEDLSSPVCQELKDHLDQCPECSLQIDSIRRTVEIYRCLPPVGVPGDVQERLRARLNLPSQGDSAEERL